MASLKLEGFNYFSLAYLPGDPDVIHHDHLCDILQPPAPQPKRKESLFDIDIAGLGRTVNDDVVWVPSQLNGSNSFLHNDPLSSYVFCYIGDETVDAPIFNPLDGFFESRDVLPVGQFIVPDEPMSN